MKSKLILTLFIFSFTYPLFSQNAFIDSNQVAIFLNGGSLWSAKSHTLSISGGCATGGILDFGYQGSFVSIESKNYYDNDKEYDAHTFIVSGILTKKRMQVSLNLAITASNANTVLDVACDPVRLLPQVVDFLGTEQRPRLPVQCRRLRARMSTPSGASRRP